MAKRKKSNEQIDKADYLFKSEIKRRFGLSDPEAKHVYILARQAERDHLGYNISETKANADYVWQVQGKKKGQMVMTSARKKGVLSK